MVVADSDLQVIRERIDRQTDLKPAAHSAAREILAALDDGELERNPLLAAFSERALENLRLILDRSASDYADAAVTSGGSIADITILGLTSEQHAKGVVFLSACQSFASLFRAGTSIRDLGSDAAVNNLQAPVSTATAAMLPLLRAAAQEFADALPGTN